MNTLFDLIPDTAIPANNITLRLNGSTIEVIFDTKTDESFEKQFKRLIRANVRGVDSISSSNRYDENTRFKIAISAYGLTRLSEMQAEIKALAVNHAQFVQAIPAQGSLF